MKLLKVGTDKYVNTERITYIEAKKHDKVIIQFQNEVCPGGMGVPSSYLELKGSEAEDFIRWLDNNAEKRRIGDLGEQFALKFERKRLENIGKEKLASRIKHIASEKGDGAGFDIESYNEDGTTRFIEVKTTKGSLGQSIYITRNELEKSKMEKDNFFLYRIYDYDEITDQAKVKIINGDLTHLCNSPVLYKISLNDVPDI